MMKNNGRRIFTQQFHHLPDFELLMEMRDLIESFGQPADKVKAWVGMPFVPSGELMNSYIRLQKIRSATNAWVVRDANGMYRIERRIFKAVVLHNGWEMDNLCWVVDVGNKRVLRTTNHGGECEMTQEDLFEKIKETEESLDELRHAGSMMGWRN
jgi:hypothetical protein